MAIKKPLFLYGGDKKELQPGDVSSLINFYFNGILQVSPTVPKIWVGSTTIAGGAGVATMFPTDTNLVTGNAIFTQEAGIFGFAFNNTGSAIAFPFGSGKLLSADKKTLTLNFGNGVTAVLLANTIADSPNGIAVYALIIGN